MFPNGNCQVHPIPQLPGAAEGAAAQYTVPPRLGVNKNEPKTHCDGQILENYR